MATLPLLTHVSVPMISYTFPILLVLLALLVVFLVFVITDLL
jgi:hypothetical protein